MHRITNDALSGRGGARRQVILDYLTENPGSSLRAICDGTGLAVGVTRHHLTILERCRMVWHERLRSRDWYFAGDYPRSRGQMQAALESALEPHLQQVMDLVREVAPACQKECLDALPWARSTSQHRLQQLVDMGHLEMRRQGRRVIYEVAPCAR